MEQLMISINKWISQNGMNLIATLVILVAGWYFAKIVRKVIRKALQKGEIDGILTSFISSIGYLGIIVLTIITALARLGVQTASLVAILGAAGLAIGLAMQESLSNFAAGILMIITKPFKAGDYIDGAGVSGTVQSIGIFSMVLKSIDNKKIIVPNSKMMNDNITNYTAEDMRRMDLVVGVSYQEDLDKVRRVLQDILDKDERILKDPAPSIGVLELAESSVNLAVNSWVKTSNYWNTFLTTQENIKKRFDVEGISIPFPQQDVHVFNAKG